MGARPVTPSPARDASRLLQAAKALFETLDRERVQVSICHEAAKILDADIAVIYTGDGTEGLRVEAAYGLGIELHGLRLAPGEGLSGLVAQSGESMLTNDYSGLADIPPVFAGFRSALAVPIEWDGRLRGVLSVGWRRLCDLGDGQLELLTAFGEIAAAAARNAHAHAGLEREARTDALTGCLNRPTLQNRLEDELERCRRTGSGLSLILIDLDDFKQVNDRHGHLVGDEVLRRVGAALRESVRAYDFVGRYGGDEFTVVAVEANEADAAEVAGRALEGLTRSVAELGLGSAGTATAGVAQWDGEESTTDLFRRADEALLEGKHTGVRGVPLRASQAQLALSESR